MKIGVANLISGPPGEEERKLRSGVHEQSTSTLVTRTGKSDAAEARWHEVQQFVDRCGKILQDGMG